MLLDRIRRTIREHDLAGARTSVVAALSGGADSVALLHLLRELDAAGDLMLAGVAHFNHQLRDNAGRDEDFCAAMAGACELPILIEREDVRARAETQGRSLEDAASAARHEFYGRARAHFAADCVAVGHTRDDQAETFLLTAYLDTRGIAHVEDETNRDVDIPRNRVRVELLPLLEARFNPNVVDVLANQSELARHEWLWMESELENANRNLEPGTLEPGTLSLDITSLREAPVALRRYAVWKAMTRVAGLRPVSFDHVEAALRLIDAAGSAGPFDGPGQSVQRIGASLVLTERAADNPLGSKANAFHYPLPVPGEVRVAEAGCIVSAELAVGSAADALRAAAGNRAVAVVANDAERCAFAVRSRRPGDRFSPLGLGGWKKLQDFLVDRKVPRAARDGVPLVVDGADRIVWVAGHEIDQAFRVTDASQAVVILTLRQV